MDNPKSLEEFWSFYMSQHSKATTRRIHFAGTLCALICISIYILSRNLLFVVAAPVLAYGLAWYSHFFVERNKPATFGHPIWSLICDLRMFFFMLTGGMDSEIKRLGKKPVSF